MSEDEVCYDRTIDRTLDKIRGRYGYHSIQRGLVGLDKALGSLNAKEDHITIK